MYELSILAGFTIGVPGEPEQRRDGEWTVCRWPDGSEVQFRLVPGGAELRANRRPVLRLMDGQLVVTIAPNVAGQ